MFDLAEEKVLVSFHVSPVPRIRLFGKNCDRAGADGTVIQAEARAWARPRLRAVPGTMPLMLNRQAA